MTQAMLLPHLLNPDALVLAVAADTEAPAPPNVGFGSIVLLLAATALMAWMGYLWLNSRRARRREETPVNLHPGMSDDELESTKLGRVLTTAVIWAAVLAVVMPLYYVNESNRQAQAAEKFHERDLEEGEKWYEFFSCINCHSPGAVGGGAEINEPRSGISTSWAAPSLNDIFYRFTAEEVTEVIIHGRSGTPMPANGLDGGGAMTKQEIQQVITYLESLQISQGEVLDEVTGAVDAALNRLDNAEPTIQAILDARLAEREDIDGAAAKFAVIEDFPTEIKLLLQAAATCTEASANMVEGTCRGDAADSDRDGLSDQAEFELTNFAAEMLRVLTQRQAGTLAIIPNGAYDVQFSRTDAFTNEDAQGEPIPDLEEADALLTALDGEHLTLSVTADRIDLFRERVDASISFLEQAMAARLWDTDVNAVAADAGITIEDATRAIGLFNAYCARCHTAGYSAGVAFQQELGSGAWGPSLRNGRALVQFPDPEDQIKFIISGSEFGVNYGVNGLGSGRMPGFGQILSREDIELIMKLERTL